jgi:hypothetical protein
MGQAPGVHDPEPVPFSGVQVLVVEQTWTQNPAWGDLYGAVDIWCPLFSLHPHWAGEVGADATTDGRSAPQLAESLVLKRSLERSGSA